MTKLIKFLFLILLLIGEASYAQTQVAALRDFEQVWNSNRGNPRGYYFEDRHHDLDKFVGEWEGMGFGNHLWRVHIVVLKKANYYHSYWSDALGLELSITKDGKACMYYPYERLAIRDLLYPRLGVCLGRRKELRTARRLQSTFRIW